MSNISINFPGGAHGNFLELVCNSVYGNLTTNVYLIRVGYPGID